MPWLGWANWALEGLGFRVYLLILADRNFCPYGFFLFFACKSEVLVFYWDRGIRSKRLDFRSSGEPSEFRGTFPSPVQSLVHQRIGDLSRTQKSVL